jgi:hypothetical protein
VDGVDISSHSDNGGTFRRGRGVDGDVVGEDAVDEGPEMDDGGGLRSLRIKSPLVVCDGGGGSSFVGLDEREEMLVRSLLVGDVEVGVDVAVVVLPRKRRTPFIVKGDMRCGVLAQRAES